MILLIEHDSGIDGWDARSKVVAAYENMGGVLFDLDAAGYTVKEGTGRLARFRHHDSSKRGMGEISYALDEGLPLNNYEFPHKA